MAQSTAIEMPDGFVWEYLGERPMITKRLGVPTVLCVWQGHCRRCGAPFEVTTRRQTAHKDGNLTLRHCKQHRLGRHDARRLRKTAS